MEKYNFQDLNRNNTVAESKNLNMLEDIPLKINCSIGQTKKTLREINYFQKGTRIPIETESNVPIDILVGEKKVGKGIVVISSEGEVFVEIT